MTRFAVHVVAAVTLLVLPVGSAAQTGSIEGRVRADDGMALRAAEVVLEGADRSTLTTAEGFFVLRDVAVGTYTLAVNLVGYGSVSRGIEVREDRTTRLEITLTTSAVELGGITVLGTRQYGSSTSTSALKMDAQVMDIPASVTVISEEFLEDQAATSLDDLFRNVAGISPFSDYQDFTARGFRQGEDEVTYNGVRSNPSNFFMSPNLSNIERVEILKGPSSVLYGSLEGGAMINIVTKSPRATPMQTFSVSVGSYEAYAASADLTGPLGGGDNLLYRLNVHYRNADSFRRFQTVDDWNVAPSITWRPGASTTLTLKGELLSADRTGRDRGISAPDGDLGALPISWTVNEPTDVASSTAYTGELNVVHGFGARWELDGKVRYTNSKYTNRYHEPIGFATENDRLVMRRQFRHQEFKWKNLGTSASLTGSVMTGGLEHRLLIGGDLTLKERLTDPNDYASPVSSLDVYDPQYGQVDPASYEGMNPVDNPFTRDYRDWGLAAQDLVTIVPAVKVLVGARYSDYYVKNANYRLDTLDEYDRSSFTWRTGVVLEPRPWASVYGSFSEGFKPQTNSQEDRGGPFDPLITRQFEGGVKTNLFEERLVSTLAVYRITKHNVLVPDPTPDSDLLLALGEVRSQGWEIDVVGSVMPQWSITANYARNEAEVTEDSRPANVGSKFPNTPKNAAAIWTRYDFRGVHLGIAGGLSYVDERDTFDDTVLPSYTVFDGAVYYDRGPYSLAVNVKNLTDERHFTGGYYNRTIFPGAPRTVQLTVRARY